MFDRIVPRETFRRLYGQETQTERWQALLIVGFLVGGMVLILAAIIVIRKVGGTPSSVTATDSFVEGIATTMVVMSAVDSEDSD